MLSLCQEQANRSSAVLINKSINALEPWAMHMHPFDLQPMWHCINKALTINSASPTKYIDLKKTWVLLVIRKIQFTWIIDLNMRDKGVNLLRHERGGCIHCLRVGKDIWSKKQKAAFLLMNEPHKLLMTKRQLGWMYIVIHRTCDTKIKPICTLWTWGPENMSLRFHFEGQVGIVGGLLT